MRAKAAAERYQLKKDEIRKKSNKYYRKMKEKLSEAAAREHKRKKAIYDFERYNSKREEINNKSKERYHKKKAESDRILFADFGKKKYPLPPSWLDDPEPQYTQHVRPAPSVRATPKPIYYEKTMSIDGEQSELQAANVSSIVIRDPSKLQTENVPTNMIEICVDLDTRKKDQMGRDSIFCRDLEADLMVEIANIVRKRLRSSFPHPIECEYMLMRVLDSVVETNPNPTNPDMNADCNFITTHHAKEWFKSLGFCNTNLTHLREYIVFRLKHLYGIGWFDYGRGSDKVVLEHAAKLKELNSEISSYLQTVLLKETQSLLEYFNSCISSDDIIVKRNGSNILTFVFLMENKSRILSCGFQEMHWQHVLGELRQRLQSYGIFSWSIGKNVIEHKNIKYYSYGGFASETIVPWSEKRYDPNTDSYYHVTLPNRYWKEYNSKFEKIGNVIVYRSKLENKGKMIVYRDNVFMIEPRPNKR